MIIKITERQYRKLIGENLSISQEEMRDKLEQITGWGDCVKLIADYYDNKIPIFHATTSEHEENITNKGFIPVDYRNRKSFGGEQGFYFQIGYSSYLDGERNILFKAEINPKFFLSHVLVDTDSIMSSEEASEILGWDIEEYIEDSEAKEFIAAVVTNDFKLDGLEFYVIDSSEPEPIPATRVNEEKYHRLINKSDTCPTHVKFSFYDKKWDKWGTRNICVDEDFYNLILDYTENKFKSENPVVSDELMDKIYDYFYETYYMPKEKIKLKTITNIDVPTISISYNPNRL